MPGPVLSAKTGKQFVPKLTELGQKKQPVAETNRGIGRQASSGLPLNKRQPPSNGLDFIVEATH